MSLPHRGAPSGNRSQFQIGQPLILWEDILKDTQTKPVTVESDNRNRLVFQFTNGLHATEVPINTDTSEISCQVCGNRVTRSSAGATSSVRSSNSQGLRPLNQSTTGPATSGLSCNKRKQPGEAECVNGALLSFPANLYDSAGLNQSTTPSDNQLPSQTNQNGHALELREGDSQAQSDDDPEPVYISATPSAFWLYRASRHHAMSAANPGTSNGTITKLITAEWYSLTDEQREVWRAQAAQKVAAHRLQHPGYKRGRYTRKQWKVDHAAWELRERARDWNKRENAARSLAWSSEQPFVNLPNSQPHAAGHTQSMRQQTATTYEVPTIVDGYDSNAPLWQSSLRTDASPRLPISPNAQLATQQCASGDNTRVSTSEVNGMKQDVADYSSMDVDGPEAHNAPSTRSHSAVHDHVCQQARHINDDDAEFLQQQDYVDPSDFLYDPHTAATLLEIEALRAKMVEDDSSIGDEFASHR
ncbi:hypothetical protein GGR57DRAFT_519732 [Xylariaceae sp. FL1272]|nr:hypothetical protein GGR57DRAFT_519732 [Xylariaceae sp. FL1272]